MIDLNKTYRTRNGDEARVWGVAKCFMQFTVRGEILKNGKWVPSAWDLDGCNSTYNGDNLVEYTPPKLRPYNSDELWELKGRWIRHKSSPDSGDMVTGIHRDLVIAGGMRYCAEVLTYFVFCKGDPEEGEPVAKEVS